jgi:hypothetical protein
LFIAIIGVCILEKSILAKFVKMPEGLISETKTPVLPILRFSNVRNTYGIDGKIVINEYRVILPLFS